MAAQIGGSIVSPTTRSRLANLMGFPPSESAKSPRDDDWFIPYNGPIEPPRNEVERRGRKRATSNATRKSYASSQGTRSFYGGGGIGEAPVNTAASMRDRASTYTTRERASTYDRMSTYSRDADWERENEREHRGSIASFLTFGQGMRKRSVIDTEPGFVFPKPPGQGRRSEESRVQGRRSEESRAHAQGRRSDESTYSTHLSHPPNRAHTPFHQHPQSQQRGRTAALSLTAADRERDRGKQREGTARDSMEVSGAPLTGSASTSAGGGSHKPPYGFGEPRHTWYEDEEADEVPSEGEWEQRQRAPQQRTLAHSTSQPVLRSPPPMRHPYAVAFPSVVYDPPPLQHLSPSVPPSHAPTNSHSTTSSKPHSHPAASSKPQQYLHSPSAAVTVTVSPAAIAAALNNNTRSLLRPRSGTISTPNLRARLAGDKTKLSRPSSAKPIAENGKRDLDKVRTQYAAETWCDALMFPRPRFRAHVVSPPSSPPDEKREEFPSLKRTASAKSPPRLDYFPAPSSPRREREHVMPSDRPRTPQKQPSPSKLPAKTQLVVSRSKHRQHPTVPASPLSPAEETLRRVIAEGEQRAREREAWNEVARTSFQNRRSRSLSRTRTRKKSGPSARVRVESDAAARDGLAARLASEAFRQPTPTISVSVSNTSAGRASESNAHSRNTSSSANGHGSGNGHTRNTSWSKVALKLCGPDDLEASPEEKLEGALMSEKTARLSVRGRREEAAEADVQFVDIVPLPVTNARDREGARLEAEPPADRSHSQNSYASDSLDVPGVGIALSTPPHPSPVDQNLPDLSAHPYAQPSAPRLRAEPVPVSASYAGPHPTSFDYPRLPRDQHVQQPEIKQSPVAWERYTGAGSPSAYAYANVAANDKRESTLGVEEVLLSRTFQRGTESGFGDGDEYGYEVEANTQPSPPREPTPPPAPAASRVRRKPVALNAAYSGIPSLSHTVTSATHTDIPDADLIHNVLRESGTAMSSPTSQGSASGHTSPRPLDDLEPFRDLFYKPDAHSGSDSHRTPSSELRRILESREEITGSWSEERIRSSEGLSGLRALARRRPSYESSLVTQEHDQDEGNRRGYGPLLDGVQEVQLGPSASPLPGLGGGSLQLGTPLRAEYEEGQNFPEDIESSRASSVIEHESHESAEETLRLGTVPLAIPETTQNERRQSTALSFGDTEDGQSQRANRDTLATTASSLGIPGTVEDLIRTSFVTTTSTTSRMSNIIGDFPVPPIAEGITPPSAAVLDSYFVPSNASDSRVHSHVSNAVSE